MSHEIMQQALEQLKRTRWASNCETGYSNDPVIAAIEAELAKPEQEKQEPVAQIRVKKGHWIETPRSIKVKSLPDGLHDLYTAPPRKEWVGLTDDEQYQIVIKCGAMSADWQDFVVAVQAKLKERNT